MSILDVALESFIDMNYDLVLLSKQIDWEAVESALSEYYCLDNGRPSVPILKKVGMMLLKNIYKLNDEGVVARCLDNPYMQYFIGEKVLQMRPQMSHYELDHRMNRHASASFVSWRQARVSRLENMISDIENEVPAGAELSLELYRAALADLLIRNI